MTLKLIVRALLGVLCATALSGCAVSELQRQRERETLQRRLVDDSIAYNEAYNEAISGQILLNILRAYNRQPRQYMSMSGFANSTPDSRSTTIGLGGLPLNELGQEWGSGGIEITGGHELEPEYRVEPFGTEEYSNLALQPTPAHVFKYYWDNGWNRDLLLIVLVDQIRVSGHGTFINNAGTISNNCEGDYANSGGCAFVEQARILARATRAGLPIVATNVEEGVCYPVATYSSPTVRPVAGASATNCPVTLVIGDTEYTLRLRSLDDAVYYVGELLRADRNAPHQPAEGVLESRLQVIAPGSRDALSPLFRVEHANDDTEREYVATVTYAGHRYSAGAGELVLL